jgi:hypothetical protein
MSYNITCWKTIASNGFKLHIEDPFEAGIIKTRNGYYEITNNENTEWWAENFYIVGNYSLETKMFDVNDICLSGEGSGNDYDKLICLFKNSIGYLRVIVIWEGGRSVSELIINDGVVDDHEYVFK